MRAASSFSPNAGSPLLPAGFGENQVPEISITASASIISSPLPLRYLISNGACSRPFDRALSKPDRLIAVTRLLVLMTSRSFVRVASGSR